ncbi:MAG: metal ABC transporter ATP-binding protein [Candidatus Cloacimonadales bacterium]
MKQKILSIENLSFGYTQNPVLQDINLSVREKEIVTIIGPNGGGKTTLLKLILGLLTPQSGSLKIYGQAPRAASKLIGYVPQHIDYDKKFPITVSDIVLSGRLKSWGFYNSQDRQKAAAVIEEFGLSKLKNQPFANLSGGQLQRALIARALVTDTKILLLDEPTSNIDLSAGSSLNTILQKLRSQLTILLVTHDTGFVTNLTDRVFCINKNAVEHPVDKNFSDIIASAYSNQSLMVRHDKIIPPQSKE